MGTREGLQAVVRSSTPRATRSASLVARVIGTGVLLLDFAGPSLLPSWQAWAMAVLGLAAGLLAIWRHPLVGMALCLVLMVLSTRVGDFGVWQLPWFLATLAVPLQHGPRTTVSALLGSALVFLVARPAMTVTDGIGLAVMFGVPTLIGLAVRALGRRSTRADEAITQLNQRVGQTREDERRLLSQELSILVGETVARTDSTLVAAAQSQDAIELRSALGQVDEQARTSLARLRAMVLTLRGATPPGSHPSLADALDDLEDELTNHAFWVETEIDPELALSTGHGDELVAAALAAVADHVRTEGVPGTTCTARLCVDEDAGSPLVTLFFEHATTAHRLRNNAALRALAARVDTAGGTLHVDQSPDSWTLHLAVPRGTTVGLAVLPPDTPAEPLRQRLTRRIAMVRWRWVVRMAALVMVALAVRTAATTDRLEVSLLIGLAVGLLVATKWPWAAAALLLTLHTIASVQVPATTVLPASISLLGLALAAVVTSRKPRWALGVMPLLVAEHLLWFRSPTSLQAVYGAGLIALPGIALGLAAHHFVTTRRSQLVELDRLAAELRLARQREQRALAGELHDIIAHQLSSISLEITSLHEDDGLVTLRRTTERVRRINESTRADLSTLLALMDEADPGRAGATTVTGWSTPSATARAVAQTLGQAGHRVTLDVMDEVDDCDPTTAHTAARVLREAGTNILRYAPPGCPVTIQASADDQMVSVRVANPMTPGAAPRHPDSTGLGLLGLAERIELTGGDFRAGAALDNWRVACALPRWLPEVTPVVGPAPVRTIWPDWLVAARGPELASS